MGLGVVQAGWQGWGGSARSVGFQLPPGWVEVPLDGGEQQAPGHQLVIHRWSLVAGRQTEGVILEDRPWGRGRGAQLETVLMTSNGRHWNSRGREIGRAHV